MSVRKKRNDDNPGSSETEDAYWHQYSNPTLWAYHAKDGVSNAITADVIGETKYLYLRDDGRNREYSGTAGLHLYNSGTEISFNHKFESLKCSDNSTISPRNSPSNSTKRPRLTLARKSRPTKHSATIWKTSSLPTAALLMT